MRGSMCARNKGSLGSAYDMAMLLNPKIKPAMIKCEAAIKSKGVRTME